MAVGVGPGLWNDDAEIGRQLKREDALERNDGGFIFPGKAPATRSPALLRDDIAGGGAYVGGEAGFRVAEEYVPDGRGETGGGSQGEGSRFGRVFGVLEPIHRLRRRGFVCRVGI